MAKSTSSSISNTSYKSPKSNYGSSPESSPIIYGGSQSANNQSQNRQYTKTPYGKTDSNQPRQQYNINTNTPGVRSPLDRSNPIDNNSNYRINSFQLDSKTRFSLQQKILKGLEYSSTVSNKGNSQPYQFGICKNCRRPMPNSSSDVCIGCSQLSRN